MTVADLIARLATFPQDAQVMKSFVAGCSECNMEMIEYQKNVETPILYHPHEAPYPYHDNTHTTVVL